MDGFRTFNIDTITLDVRVSCDTFWNYKFNVPIRINDYYNPADSRNRRNMNSHARGGRGGGGGGGGGAHEAAATETCYFGNVGRSDPMFINLETYLVDHVIHGIYEDLVKKRQQKDILILLKKARKFHIHGCTLEDILFPQGNVNRNDRDGHMMPENIVYICTHC